MTRKKLEFIPPFNRIKAEQTKTNDFSKTHQKLDVTRQSGSLTSGETNKYRESQPPSPSPRGEATTAMKQQEYFNDHFNELLEAECGFA